MLMLHLVGDCILYPIGGILVSFFGKCHIFCLTVARANAIQGNFSCVAYDPEVPSSICDLICLAVVFMKLVTPVAI